MPSRRTFAAAFQAILFGTAVAGRVSSHLTWLSAPPVAQVFNLCVFQVRIELWCDSGRGSMPPAGCGAATMLKDHV